MNDNKIGNRSSCPLATALDVVGDKWTLLILRSLMYSQRRFVDLLEMPENISTNILASRLEHCERNDLIQRKLYHKRPPRYEYHLTRKGSDLLPAMQALIAWSLQYHPENDTLPEWFEVKEPTELRSKAV